MARIKINARPEGGPNAPRQLGEIRAGGVKFAEHTQHTGFVRNLISNLATRTYLYEILHRKKEKRELND